VRDPSSLYAFETGVSQDALSARDLVLVLALAGPMDAGGAVREAGTYLRDHLENERVVTIDADEVIDYRSSRPRATFDGSSFTDIQLPELAVWLLRDEAGTPFLLLEGPEPDLHWAALADAIAEIVEYFEVRLTVTLHAIPMAVPHTRPIGLIAHATRADLIEREEQAELEPDAEMIFPASFDSVVEHRLGVRGHDALGYTAQIPHYLSRAEFPSGALALLRRLSESAGLELPLVGLGDLADQAMADLGHQLTDNEEVQELVLALENQYDAFVRGSGASLLATTLDTPTADEIGDLFERFLATQDEDPGDDARDDDAPHDDAPHDDGTGDRAEEERGD
jgi:hypothetical protein